MKQPWGEKGENETALPNLRVRGRNNLQF